MSSCLYSLSVLKNVHKKLNDEDQDIIHFQDYPKSENLVTLKDRLGKGGQASVFECTLKNKDGKFAAKMRSSFKNETYA